MAPRSATSPGRSNWSLGPPERHSRSRLGKLTATLRHSAGLEQSAAFDLARRRWLPAEYAAPPIEVRALALLRDHGLHRGAACHALQRACLIVEPLERAEFFLAPELRAAHR